MVWCPEVHREFLPGTRLLSRAQRDADDRVPDRCAKETAIVDGDVPFFIVGRCSLKRSF